MGSDFFFVGYGDHRALHSFPTRRPSDLDGVRADRRIPGRALPGEDSLHVDVAALPYRSEEHTSELQSHSDLVCRLLLEKKRPIVTLVLLDTPSQHVVTDLIQQLQN